MKLATLGFTESDCEIALEKCNGYLDDAALWLTQNAIPNNENILANDHLPFEAVVLETICLKICIIDDCRDSDVPLIELTLINLLLKQNYNGPGEISGAFGIDYYNRVLSGWEPFIEQWQASMRWEQTLSSSLKSKRLRIKVDSTHSIDINVTSSLIDLISLVKENWTQDYLSRSSVTANKLPGSSSQNYRRRSPFVPFALKNETGSKLWFKTLIATAEDDKIIDRNFLKKSVLEKDATWLEVQVGETIPFSFENRGKLRHQTTHVTRRHQVAVLVSGWKVVEPVTIDRVGVYFRHADVDLKATEVSFFRLLKKKCFVLLLYNKCFSDNQQNKNCIFR